MSAGHNHPPRCCCPPCDCDDRCDQFTKTPCPSCPEHGALAGIPRDNIWRGTALESVETMLAAAEEPIPYTEQETTKVEERPDDDPAPVATCNGRDCGGRPHE